MNIKFYRENVYGNSLVYIAAHVSEEMHFASESIKRLTHKRTLSDSDMDALANLGFTFEEVLAPRK